MSEAEQHQPVIVFRTYTWKGEDWVAIYIDNKAVRLPLDRNKATWMADRVGATIIYGGESRNPAYFKRWGMQTDPPPLQKPYPGIIRHPHLQDDGTWAVAPSRRLGPDLVSDSTDSSSPDES